MNSCALCVVEVAYCFTLVPQLSTPASPDFVVLYDAWCGVEPWLASLTLVPQSLAQAWDSCFSWPLLSTSVVHAQNPSRLRRLRVLGGVGAREGIREHHRLALDDAGDGAGEVLVVAEIHGTSCHDAEVSMLTDSCETKSVWYRPCCEPDYWQRLICKAFRGFPASRVSTA